MANWFCLVKKINEIKSGLCSHFLCTFSSSYTKDQKGRQGEQANGPGQPCSGANYGMCTAEMREESKAHGAS